MTFPWIERSPSTTSPGSAGRLLQRGVESDQQGDLWFDRDTVGEQVDGLHVEVERIHLEPKPALARPAEAPRPRGSRPRPRTHVYRMRLDDQEMSKLQTLAKRRGVTVSVILRELVRGARATTLTEEVRK